VQKRRGKRVQNETQEKGMDAVGTGFSGGMIVYYLDENGFSRHSKRLNI